tara:strand:+ start:42629 stop:43249 length:621 start_codon:yes stop_codon:yes gene_type:complete
MKKLVLLATICFSAISIAQESPKTGRVGPAYIGGMEYWPFDDSIPGSPYPDRVLWSYEEGTDAAKKCMLQGNKLLVSWLEDASHPVTKALKEYKEIGGSADFFMWTNDYTKAPSQAARGMRKARVWWWSGSGSDTSGWLKFESTVLPDGTCTNPKPEQIVTYIESRYSLFAAAPSENIQDSNRQESAEPGIINRIQNFFNSNSSAR